MSRRTKINKKLISDAVKYLQAGNYKETIAALLNIAECTWYAWEKRGRDDIEAGKRSLYAEFTEAVEEAQAYAEVRIIGGIAKLAASGETDSVKLNALQWMAERKFPKKWGRKEQIKQEVSGPDNTPLVMPSFVVNFVSPESKDKKQSSE